MRHPLGDGRSRLPLAPLPLPPPLLLLLLLLLLLAPRRAAAATTYCASGATGLGGIVDLPNCDISSGAATSVAACSSRCANTTNCRSWVTMFPFTSGGTCWLKYSSGLGPCAFTLSTARNVGLMGYYGGGPSGNSCVTGATGCSCYCSAGFGWNGTTCALCAAGSAQAGGGSSCAACAAGSYSAVDGAASCTNCTAGTASLIAGSGSACAACAAGYYSSAAGATICSACAVGSVSAAGARNCSLCAAGTYGLVQPLAGGNVLLSQGKPALSSSTYSAGVYYNAAIYGNDGILTTGAGGQQFVNTACTTADAVPWWQVDLGAPMQVSYINFYDRPGWTRGDGLMIYVGNSSCATSGTASTFGPPAGLPPSYAGPSGAMVACPAVSGQTYTPPIFNMSTITLTMAQAQMSLDQSSGLTVPMANAVQVQCPLIGRYVVVAIPTNCLNFLEVQVVGPPTQQICAACPAGTFSAPGATSCTNCPAGTYAASAGLTACLPCAAGSISGPGATTCAACPSGSSSPAGSAACTSSCTAGAGWDGASCSACAAGAYSYGGGSCAACAGWSPLVSAVGGCQPPSQLAAVGPLDTAFYLSGSAAEGVGAFPVVGGPALNAIPPASAAFVSNRFASATGALNLAGTGFLAAPGGGAPPALPGGASDYSASAWLRVLPYQG